MRAMKHLDFVAGVMTFVIGIVTWLWPNMAGAIIAVIAVTIFVSLPRE